MSAGEDRPTGRPHAARTGRGLPPPGAAAAPADGGTEARARAAYAALLRQLTVRQRADAVPEAPGTAPASRTPYGAGPGGTDQGGTDQGGKGADGAETDGAPLPGPDGATADALPEDVARWLTERRLLHSSRAGVSSPERAITELLSEHRERLLSACTTLQRDLRAVEDVARLLPPPRLHGHDTVPVEFFTDREQLRRRIDAFHPLTRHELLSMRTTFPEPEVLEESLVTDLRLLARGAACRLLVSASALRRPGAARYVESVAEAGAEVRVATSVPLYLLIIDRELTVMWAGLGSDRDRGDVALHGSLIAACFVQVFEHSWAAASPHIPGPSADRAQTARDYTSREREVLALLATGAKDESIARRLGISERTLRRLMTQLVEKLGVESRFAAGVRAARLGLVD
ncbi:LuxR C-terminal-related transcriptional regulator [Streptomyces sp. S07_1.15]|uniref:helix-turn-helix transcriptional regulator n=1 Tax=Streptomyces sp. S07_1.15 TaxID=2873925 RepID=UPI001D138D31|nr:LuxR C-terminal-related transcriptional regulator [Streptomyces sp. S07_1.15]MCC3654223.1 LuxR C-terminal-related transcriptional regulator [Streptomyces sp. S07_1.15]